MGSAAQPSLPCAERKSKRKIRIKKMIRRKIQIKSKTAEPG